MLSMVKNLKRFTYLFLDLLFVLYVGHCKLLINIYFQFGIFLYSWTNSKIEVMIMSILNLIVNGQN